MSLSGILNTHLMIAYVIRTFGNDEQRAALPAARWRAARSAPRSASPRRTPAATRSASAPSPSRRGDSYFVNGSKMWSTNARTGTMFGLVVKTDPDGRPAAPGHHPAARREGTPSRAARSAATCPSSATRASSPSEVAFEDFPVPVDEPGRQGGRGLQVRHGRPRGRPREHRGARRRRRAGRVRRCAQVLAASARPSASRSASTRRSSSSSPTWRPRSRRRASSRAAPREKKDRGERSDVEAGMAKLFASEICHEVALDAMRIHGGYGYSQEFTGRALLPRRAADDHRRGHQRDPAPGDRARPARARRLQELRKSGLAFRLSAWEVPPA